MNRLGIDYGEKRWGISFSDELNIATPQPAIIENELEQKWSSLRRLVEERVVREFVVGYPYNMDGSAGFKAAEVDSFISELEDRHPGIPVKRVDERLTSVTAGEGWSEKKKRGERKSGKLDSKAATLILQDYLDQLLPIENTQVDHDDLGEY